MTSAIPRPRRPATGYVLLATLLLLTLVATAMTAACRLSLRRAADADAAERSLQDRWAAVSCCRALLPRCESVLASGGERSVAGRPSSARRIIVLCGRAVRLTFGDEQAKVNVGELVRRSGRSGAENAIRELLSGTGTAGRVNLVPAVPPGGRRPGGMLPVVPELGWGSYGTILDSIAPAELLGDRYGTLGPAGILTCWGDGRLNWRRASERAMREVLSPPLDLWQVASLVAMRDRPSLVGGGRMPLSGALDGLGLKAGERVAAAQRLSDGSACHSLWVATAGVGGGAAAYREYVRDESRLPAATYGFEW